MFSFTLRIRHGFTNIFIFMLGVFYFDTMRYTLIYYRRWEWNFVNVKHETL